MEKTFIEYEIMPADIDESIYDHLDVGDRVVALAQDKCKLCIRTAIYIGVNSQVQNYP